MKLSILAPEPNSENTVHEQQLIKGGFRNGKLLIKLILIITFSTCQSSDIKSCKYMYSSNCPLYTGIVLFPTGSTALYRFKDFI